MGIDIRNGLQMECIACAQCVDACDAVMDKVGLPRGLIRYDSLNGLERKPKRVLRPRLYAYGAMALVTSVALVVALVTRKPFEANVLRAAGSPYVLDGNVVRNQLEVHLVNKSPEPTRFEVKVTGPEALSVVLPQPTVTLAPMESFRLPIFLSAPRSEAKKLGEAELVVSDGENVRTSPVRFLSPP
jgi:polyferredoxin